MKTCVMIVLFIAISAATANADTITREASFPNGRMAIINETIKGGDLHSWVVHIKKRQRLGVLIKAKFAAFQIYGNGKPMKNRNNSRLASAYEEYVPAGLYNVIVFPAYGAEDYELTIMTQQ